MSAVLEHLAWAAVMTLALLDYELLIAGLS